MIRFVLPLLLTGFLVSVAGAAAPPRDLIVSYPTAGAYLGQNATITITDFNHYDGLSRNKSIELLYPNGTRNLLTREFFEGPSERYCVRANTTLKVEPPMSQVGM